MILNNLFDYSNQDDQTGFKFWIPECDPAITFPYEVDRDGIIVDRNGEPAIFAVWMLDSLDWDLWTEVKDGPTVENDSQQVQEEPPPVPASQKKYGDGK